MKGKLFVGGVSAAVLAGGMVFITGCASLENEPMPPGAYVPSESKAPFTVKGTQSVSVEAEPVVPVAPVETVTPAVPETAKPVTVDTPAKPLPPVAPAVKPAKKTEKPVVAPKKEDVTHVIKKGDSFWTIAALYGARVDDVVAANSGMNPLKLRIGDKVIVPLSGKTVKPAAKSVKPAAKSAKRVKKTVAKPVKDDGRYVVRKGDSFSRIAARHRIKAADLAAANNMTLDQVLKVGQKLVIPKRGATAAKRTKPVNTAPTKTVKKASAPAKPEAKEETVPPVPAAENTVPAAENTVPAVPVAPAPASEPVASDAAPVAPAPASEPVASDAALSAVAQDTTPTAVPVTQGYTADIDVDTTLEELAKKYGFGVAELKKLNPEIPADGKVRAGSVIKLP